MKIENWSLTRKTILLVAIPATLQTILIAVALGIWLHAEHLANKVARAKDLSLELQVFQKTMGDCVASCGVARATFGQLGVEQAHAQLKKLTRGYQKLQLSATVNTKVSPEWQTMDKAVERLKYGFKLALGETEQGRVGSGVIKERALRDFRILIDAVQKVSAMECREIDPAIAEADRVNATLRFVLLGLIVASALVATGLVELYRKNIATRLLAVMETTELMSHRCPLKPAISGSDEIATMDRQLHEIDAKLDEAMRNEKLVIANAADLVCTLDSRATILSVNERALQQMTGMKPDALIGRQLVEHIAIEQKEEVLEKLLGARDSNSTLKFKCDLVTNSRKNVPTEWTVHWSDVDGALFCVAHDQTQERALSSLRQEFLASMHSELHQPLNRIYQSLTNLTDNEIDPLPKRSRSELQRAQQSLIRLLALVEDLLEVENMASKELTLNLTKQKVNSIVEESINSLSALARTSDIKITSDIQSDLYVNVDRVRIIQVLVNVLSNALKYSPNGSNVNIYCETEATHTTIFVRDEGPGIPESYQDQIFAAFEQVPGRSTKRAASSGLGLSICKTIVEAHKGAIGVYSSPPDGSRFWIKLPRWRSESNKCAELEA
ncbi:MAG: PAS domain-containing sensor histidine kinase [Candidatus Obscuribacterales bacterium]|nr:PAS domain-containing sensor histidine kinase [Candidatus Obscuribacterales bacterium]